MSHHAGNFFCEAAAEMPDSGWPWYGDASLELSDLGPGIDVIPDFAPLGPQFGVASPLTIPPALRDLLFSEGPLMADQRSLNTFAVLDAARVFGLVESLEDSGLEHGCLFQGKAADDFRDVAPWIVRLEQNNRFTRSIFTEGEGSSDLWDRDASLLLRSPMSLEALRRHFRKFTKVRDTEGKWFYLRFWTESFWAAIASTPDLMGHPIAAGLLQDISLLILKVEQGNACWTVTPTRSDQPRPGRIAIDDDLRGALNAEIDRRRVNDEIRYALSGANPGKMTFQEGYNLLKRLRSWLIQCGFSQSDQRGTAMRLLVDKSLLQGNPWPLSLREMLSDRSRGVGIRLWMLEMKDWE
ncbi:DUF4123 domain-containing protein [Pseudooceanicola spongiae]|uniref:DUF4123 domain-containing protein n=1 Tax=Pseudooceanicola spongiae TaxID=2613965 RepID=A0A7L9WKU9_9RHOB|nr:DUF4123 domain-containing protein [Pseudooceanicola spongiae]QOL80523.1 DUF4123 domain-containing protein [Pseudooceanicola spongiae]